MTQKPNYVPWSSNLLTLPPDGYKPPQGPPQYLSKEQMAPEPQGWNATEAAELVQQEADMQGDKLANAAQGQGVPAANLAARVKALMMQLGITPPAGQPVPPPGHKAPSPALAGPAALQGTSAGQMMQQYPQWAPRGAPPKPRGRR